MPVTIGSKRRRSGPSDEDGAAKVYAKLVALVRPLDMMQRLELANALGDGTPLDELSPELVELLEAFHRWARLYLTPPAGR